MAEIDSQFVKRGYWVNLDQGRIMGQTITTDSRTGATIVALLAIITSLGMSHLWKLLTFFYHQIRANRIPANGHPTDGLFRHQQALLRTSPTPSSLMAHSISLWLVWRRVATCKHPLLRSIMHTSTAALFAMASIAVSIFSSLVVTSTNLEVLVQSPHCGILLEGGQWDAYASAVLSAAESYGPDCYKEGDLPNRCDIFTRPNIPFRTEEVPCPFEDKMCDSPAFAMDSGLVDLNDAFGLNLDDAHRIRYRRKKTCALLTSDGYTRVVDTADLPKTIVGRDLLPGEQSMLFLYGSHAIEPPLEFAMALDLTASNITRSFGHLGMSNAPRVNSTFKMIPELKRTDADTMLRLVAKNAVSYFNPVNDPLFAAHRAQDFLADMFPSPAQNITIYRSDVEGTVVGCTSQHQYCLTPDSCTNLRAQPFLADRVIFPNATDIQRATLQLLANNAQLNDIPDIKRNAVDKYLAGSVFITELPDDQWIKELQDWESILWAGYQIAFADRAIGPAVRAPDARDAVIAPNSEAERKLCSMQKMRKPGGFVNINFFGLIFTIVVSCTIVILDLTLAPSLVYLRKFRKGHTSRIDRWIQDGIFHLVRRSYEAQGQGIWKGLTEEIPVTLDGDDLEDLGTETLSLPSRTGNSSLHKPTMVVQTHPYSTSPDPPFVSIEPSMAPTEQLGTSTEQHLPPGISEQTSPVRSRHPPVQDTDVVQQGRDRHGHL